MPALPAGDFLAEGSARSRRSRSHSLQFGQIGSGGGNGLAVRKHARSKPAFRPFPRDFWCDTARDCMLGRDQVPLFAENEEAADALAELGGASSNGGIVVSDGRLAGLPSMSGLARARGETEPPATTRGAICAVDPRGFRRPERFGSAGFRKPAGRVGFSKWFNRRRPPAIHPLHRLRSADCCRDLAEVRQPIPRVGAPVGARPRASIPHLVRAHALSWCVGAAHQKESGEALQSGANSLGPELASHSASMTPSKGP
jgi:hypothetical protein